MPTPPILFGRFNVLSYEKGTPDNKYAAAINWSLGGWGATLRAIRYGEVLSPDPNPALDFTLSPKTLVDIEARLAITEHIKLALGADNLTDEYPDPLPPQNNLTGTQSFSNYSPFGRSGRFVYGRVNYSFGLTRSHCDGGASHRGPRATIDSAYRRRALEDASRTSREHHVGAKRQRQQQSTIATTSSAKPSSVNLSSCTTVGSSAMKNIMRLGIRERQRQTPQEQLNRLLTLSSISGPSSETGAAGAVHSL